MRSNYADFGPSLAAEMLLSRHDLEVSRETSRKWILLLLPYSVFSEGQRVSHTALVENKRLGHALALIKAQQNKHFEAKVKTNSEKDGCQKRGRRFTGLIMCRQSPSSPLG